jgi:hypothetical protein
VLRVAELFNRSASTKYLVCFHKPHVVVQNCDFHVQPIASIGTRMTGSSEQHTAYVYARPELLPAAEREQWDKYRAVMKEKRDKALAERKAAAAAKSQSHASAAADATDSSDWDWDTSCSESDENQDIPLESITLGKRKAKEQKTITLVDSKFGARTGTVAESKFAAGHTISFLPLFLSVFLPYTCANV